MNITRSLIAVAVATGFLAPAASADTVGPGDALYLVISQNFAEFGTYEGPGGGEVITGSENLPENAQGQGLTNGYVVVNFLAFTGGTFPGGLTATVHGALLSMLGLSIDDLAGHQFFLIGSFQDHLMLGAARIPGNFPNPIADPWEAAVLAGLQNISSLGEGILAPGGAISIIDDAFWNLFVTSSDNPFSDVQFADIINGGGPNVGWQVYSSLDGSGSGSENVFGFSDPNSVGFVSVNSNQGPNPTGGWQSTNSIQQDQLPVPEPSTLALLLGGVALGALRRRKARAAGK